MSKEKEFVFKSIGMLAYIGEYKAVSDTTLVKDKGS